MKTPSAPPHPRVSQAESSSGTAWVLRSRRRPATLRSLLRIAPWVPRNSPLYIAAYCQTETCPVRWHRRLVVDLLALTPIPVRLKCPECGRRLYHYAFRGHRYSGMLHGKKKLMKSKTVARRRRGLTKKRRR